MVEEDTLLLENPQLTIDQVREATALLELIPRLLEENERLRAEAQSAHLETEQLRHELERFRSEREELGEAFGRMMGEVGTIMGEFAPRFRLGHLQRPSPFSRDTNGTAPANGATSQH